MRNLGHDCQQVIFLVKTASKFDLSRRAIFHER